MQPTLILHPVSNPDPDYTAFVKKNTKSMRKAVCKLGLCSLRVDSLTPRQMESLCWGDGKFDQPVAQDAYDAKSYLMELPFIDKDKIAVVGWGKGCTSSLIAIDDTSKINNRGIPFRAAVAFYPRSVPEIRKQNAPLLVLAGEKDVHVSVVTLRTILSLSKSPYETNLKIYENAKHCFDWEGDSKISSEFGGSA